jgi:hypothetical protein
MNRVSLSYAAAGTIGGWSMTTTTSEALLEAVEQVRSLLRADGADLRVLALDEAALEVELALDFADVSCEECVLPPSSLRDTVLAALNRSAGAPVNLVLHDPRAEAAGAGVVDNGPVGQLIVLDPTGIAPDVGPPNPGPDAGPLKGRTVAIRHDILWRSFDWTVEEWTASLEQAGARVLTWRRVQGLVGADYERAQAEYEAMLAQADIAISGLANCGSCTSWSVRDALTAVARGLPTTAVATAHFEPLARELAADGGRPGLRLTVLPYPFDTLGEAEVRAHARRLFPQLVEALGAVV